MADTDPQIHRLLGWASLDPAADSINDDASAPKQDADKPARSPNRGRLWLSLIMILAVAVLGTYYLTLPTKPLWCSATGGTITVIGVSGIDRDHSTLDCSDNLPVWVKEAVVHCNDDWNNIDAKLRGLQKEISDPATYSKPPPNPPQWNQLTLAGGEVRLHTFRPTGMWCRYDLTAKKVLGYY